MGRAALKKPKDSPEAAKPSALLQNLAAIAAHASGAHRTYRDARHGSSSGPASAGKQLTSWGCACGWTGSAKELLVREGGLRCPSCDGAHGLKPT